MDRVQANLLPRNGGRAVIERQPTMGPSAVVCSLATGRHRDLLAESAPTLVAYAQRHGWSVVLSSEDLEPSRPASWSKITLIQDLLTKFEFVLWVDADALIVDLDRNILDEVSDDADIWFARHPQERRDDASVFNAGIILARSSTFTTELLTAMWNSAQFIQHNWWENAALLDLLGYSLEPPYAHVRSSHWHDRVGQLDLAWNSVPGYCEAAHPAINHHARSDHDNFNRRLEAMAADRRATMAKFPADFVRLRSPSSAGVDDAPRRTHDFTGVQIAGEPTKEELFALIERLDADNEAQRLRLLAAFDWLETAVTDKASAEHRAAAATQELEALRNTKLFRLASPLRAGYARLRRRRG